MGGRCGKESKDLNKVKQPKDKDTRKKAGYLGRIFARIARCISAAVISITLAAFPAMAQGAVLISPQALQKLQSVSPAEGGVQTITMPAEEFFTGAAGITSAVQLIEELKKYQPSDWTAAGNDSADCFFQDGTGSLLITFETSGSTLYVTVDGTSMDGIISRILATNNSYAAQTAADDTSAVSADTAASDTVNTSTAASNTANTSAAASSMAAWRLDGVGWWYDNGDGTWPANGWHWIDGNHDGISECYYFNENGYILTNTLTPDFYLVNADGAWVQDGIVQVR